MLVIDVEAVAIPDVDTYLEPVSAPSNYRDVEKIAAYQLEARAAQIDKAALDIDLAMIVAVGCYLPGWEQPDVCVLDDTHSEADLLSWLWGTWRANGCPQFVTFNGLGYDLPLLLRRSLYLNVAAPTIQIDRFKHPQVIDLMQILSLDGRLKFKSLNFYCNRFNLSTGEPDITGKDVGAAWKAGDFAAVERHCAMDVAATAALATRMGLLKAAQPAREVTGAF